LNRAILLVAGISVALISGTLVALLITGGRDEAQPIAATSSAGVEARRTSVDRLGGPGTARLEWQGVDDPRVRGYRIYYGPSKGQYLQRRGQGVDAGELTSYTLKGLASARRYYFAVTAYDAWYNESAYSNEVFKDMP
jgi:hypothetical protein